MGTPEEAADAQRARVGRPPSAPASPCPERRRRRATGRRARVGPRSAGMTAARRAGADAADRRRRRARAVARGAAARGRSRRPRPVAVAVAGGRLHDLPAAVPLPGHRPAPRGAERGGHPRHGRARGARAALRPAGRRAHPRRGRRRWSARSGRRCSRPSPSWPALLDGDDGAEPRRLPSSSPAPAACSSTYFALEDPTRLEPAERELHVEVDARRPASLLRGFVDRLDVAPAGEMRVVDYKTGRAPREGFEAEGDVPDALLRAGAVAAARHESRGCCSCSTSAAARSCATSPTRPTCAPPSARSRRCGGRSSARHRDRRLAAQPVPAVRLVRPPAPRARPGAAPRRRCPRLPVGRAGAETAPGRARACPDAGGHPDAAPARPS